MTTKPKVECRHVTYLGEKGGNDTHLVKIQTHNEDGTLTPSIKLVHNFERSFYVTKKQFRTFKQKRERSPMNELSEFRARECDLDRSMGTALNMRGKRRGDLFKSPYIFGANVPTAALLKDAFAKKYGMSETAYTVAGFDLETDVVTGSEAIIISSIAFEKEIKVYVLRDFLPNESDTEIRKQLAAAQKKYLGYLEEKGVTMEYYFCDTEKEVILASIGQLHAWQPDIVAIHNMMYDIPYVEKRAKVLDINLRDLWSDPCIPKHLRKYWLEEGRDSAITEDGKFTKIQFEDRWHTLHCTAGFQVVDSMCTYRRLRTQQARLPSYSLDNLAKREGVPPKVEIEGCEGYKKLALHIFQQTHKKIEYIVYGGNDPYTILELDAETLDMQLTLPTFQDNVPFAYAAKPSKVSDITSYFYNLEEHNHVLGVATYIDKDDKEAVKEDRALNRQLSTSNWIVTVDAWKTTLNGSRCLVEDAQRITNVRLYGYDDD